MKKISAIIVLLVFLQPASVAFAQSRLESSNYAIIDSSVDSTAGTSSSTNYDMLNSINPTADSRLTSGSYALGSGFPSGIQANVPTIRCAEASTDDTGGGPPNTACTDPALTAATGGADTIVGNGMLGVCGNPGCYDKAKVEVNPQNNPTDGLFLVAVSTDNFAVAANTRYLRNDRTLSLTVTSANFMTTCALHGYDSRLTTCDDSGDGSWSQTQQEYNMSGLQCGTLYYVKSRAINGDFTQTQYSSVSNFTTECPSVSLDLDISPINTETAAPYSIDLGALTTSVTTASSFIWLDVSTNAANGVTVSVNDANNGLFAATIPATISSETENLAASDGDGGIGLQATSANQTALGPLQISPTYNVAADNVANFNTGMQTIFFTNTTGLNRGPINAGRGQMTLKARGDTGLASGAYSDIITFTASASW